MRMSQSVRVIKVPPERWSPDQQLVGGASKTIHIGLCCWLASVPQLWRPIQRSTGTSDVPRITACSEVEDPKQPTIVDQKVVWLNISVNEPFDQSPAVL